VNPPRSACGAPPQGGVACGPAKPVPRRLLGWVRSVLAASWLALGVTTLVCLPAVANTDVPAGLVEQGRKTYGSLCARCHGVDMVTTGAAYDLRRFPADQKERFERSVIQGVRAMPAWASVLAPGDIDALWAYLETRRTP
jgi:cytochrome c55X